MATETLMTRTPRSGGARKGLRLRVPTPPAASGAAQEFEAHFFDWRGAPLGVAPVSNEGADAPRGSEELSFLRVVVAPRGTDPRRAAASGHWPAAACDPADPSGFSLPPGWWACFRPENAATLRGRVTRSFGACRMPLAYGRVEVCRVDPWPWSDERGAVAFRDPRLAGAPPPAGVPDERLRLERIGSFPIQADGSFFGVIESAPPGAPQHLYFAVLQDVQKTPLIVHAPAVRAGTCWNWRGEPVEIAVTHPRAVCRDPLAPLGEEHVCFAGVGFDPICGEGAGGGIAQEEPFLGCYRHADGTFSAYAGRLHFPLAMDLAALHEAGARWYRFSWRRGRWQPGEQRVDGGDSPWTAIVNPIHRTRRQPVPGSGARGRAAGDEPGFVLRPHSLAPDPDELPDALAATEGIFRLPDPGDSALITSLEERAWAIWDAGEARGLCTVRVQIYGEDGADLTPRIAFAMRRSSGSGRSGPEPAPCGPCIYVHVDPRQPAARNPFAVPPHAGAVRPTAPPRDGLHRNPRRDTMNWHYGTLPYSPWAWGNPAYGHFGAACFAPHPGFANQGAWNGWGAYPNPFPGFAANPPWAGYGNRYHAGIPWTPFPPPNYGFAPYPFAPMPPQPFPPPAANSWYGWNGWYSGATNNGTGMGDTAGAAEHPDLREMFRNAGPGNCMTNEPAIANF